MAEQTEKLSVKELLLRSSEELTSLRASKLEDLRKARFKHALGQLRQTHSLRQLRREVALVATAMTQRQASGEERT